MSLYLKEKTVTRPRPSAPLPRPAPRSRKSISTVYSSRETRAVSETRRRWTRHLFLGGLFILAQLLFAYSQMFQVKDIYVSGNKHVTRDQVIKACGLVNGQYLWKQSPLHVAQALTNLHQVEKATVTFGLPGRVEIVIEERQPVLQVSARSSHPKWFLVDKEGFVLRPLARSQNDLPRLMVEQQLKPGERLHSATLFTCATAAAPIEKAFPGSVWYYCVDDRGDLSFRTFANRTQVDVHIGDLDRLPYKLRVLGAILGEVASKQQVCVVDLRYGSPVVKLLHPPPPNPEDATPQP